ncbi:MAG: DUF5678 domain-containing protein [Thaumarchaeota archaeon]|nr:DUF5678 domain-containing protein [Nitrososphaerota archaeon]
MSSEYEYVMSKNIRGKYLGKWISLVDKEIVAAGQDAKVVYDKAKKKYPDKIPFIIKIPKERDMLL